MTANTQVIVSANKTQVLRTIEIISAADVTNNFDGTYTYGSYDFSSPEVTPAAGDLVVLASSGANSLMKASDYSNSYQSMNAGFFKWSFPITLAQITGAGDVLSAMELAFAGTITNIDAYVTSAVTTGSKAATLNLEIGSTNLTGGTVALTSANCTPLGAKIAGAAITGAASFSSGDTLSIEAASVTAFAEGAIVLVVDGTID
jgi:hypothetical protein